MTAWSRCGRALVAVEAMVDPAAPYLMLGRLTQADITAFVVERLARFGLNVDSGRRSAAAACPRAQAGGRDCLPVDRGLGGSARRPGAWVDGRGEACDMMISHAHPRA